MEKLGKQALMHAENLTLPPFQIIVISASLSCDYCRHRVSHIMSKMTGLREYTVDVRNKLVVVKSDFNLSCSKRNENHSPRKNPNHIWLSFKFPISFLRPTCISGCFV